ncbi:hypothetical protein ACP4OV_023786 [Aristida adscensionis]
MPQLKHTLSVLSDTQPRSLPADKDPRSRLLLSSRRADDPRRRPAADHHPRSAMSEPRACELLLARDPRCLQFRVRHAARTDAAAVAAATPPPPPVEASITLVAGFKCTATFWPSVARRREPGPWTKLSVVVTRTEHPRVEAPRAVTAHIDLRTRAGLPARTAVHEPVPAAGDCAGGASLFARREEIEDDCVADGHLVALCTVAIFKDWPPAALPVPYCLGHSIYQMPDLADVSFKVEGKVFKAHRLVLAARSPVFKAELYGDTADDDKCPASLVVTIEDIRATTFKFMLYYMYHGVLPAAPPDMDGASLMVEFQHLFVAAGRYGLEALKQMCEELLCVGVSKDTVISALEFTEDHTCPKLKSRCLDFVSVPENFQKLAATEEYIRLMYSLPSLRLDVENRNKRAKLA